MMSVYQILQSQIQIRLITSIKDVIPIGARSWLLRLGIPGLHHADERLQKPERFFLWKLAEQSVPMSEASGALDLDYVMQMTLTCTLCMMGLHLELQMVAYYDFKLAGFQGR
jgi:hypothetical protein